MLLVVAKGSKANLAADSWRQLGDGGFRLVHAGYGHPETHDKFQESTFGVAPTPRLGPVVAGAI